MIPWLYRLTQWGVRQWFYRLFWTRDFDACRIPREGPVIIAGNHASFWDPMLIAAVFPRPVGFMARRSLFRFPLFGWYIKALNAFPLDRGGDPRAALRGFGERLDRGEAVVIFPEGTRTCDGRLQPLREGAGLLAVRHGAPILPLYLWGTFQSWPRGRWLPRRHRLRVYVGEPLHPEESGQAIGRKELGRRLEASLLALQARAFAENGEPAGHRI